MNYQLIADFDGVLLINGDGSVCSIPSGNRLYAAYEAWLAAGNVPLPVEQPERAPTLAELQQELKDAVTAFRWRRETSGVNIGNGVIVGTTTEDQNRITTVLARAQLGDMASVDFKADTGWVTLTIDEIRAIGVAIGNWVQECFTRERAHHAAIDALTTVAEAQAYDVTAGWST